MGKDQKVPVEATGSVATADTQGADKGTVVHKRYSIASAGDLSGNGQAQKREPAFGAHKGGEISCKCNNATQSLHMWWARNTRQKCSRPVNGTVTTRYQCRTPSGE